jgi:transmembrane sensor
MDTHFHSPIDRFVTLLPRQLSGSISSDENVELSQILSNYPDLRLQAELFAGMWYQEKKIFPSLEVKEAYMRHFLKYKSEFLFDGDQDQIGGINNAEINFNSAKSVFLPKWRKSMAAVLLLTIIVTSFLFFYNRKSVLQEQSPAISSVITKYGNKSKISLPDGSQVWLNAGSRLDYNSLDFNKTLREVDLSGEAYFDIAHNVAKPFIVRSGKMRIRVLGTMFNVKAYPEEKNIETSLIKGSVEITIDDRPQDKYILSPNEKLVISNNGFAQKSPALNTVNVSKADRENTDIIALKKVEYHAIEKIVVETAWVQNKLVFKSEKFSDLAKRMERWYDIEIRFRNLSKEELKFTGIFTSETIQQALKAMQVVHSFTYMKENNIIFID